MNRFLAALFLFGLSACGSSHFIDPRVQPFVTQFAIDMGITIPEQLEVDISDLTDEVSGICYVTEDQEYMHVSIDSDWDKWSFLMKEETVYHELGHCVLGADHDDTVITDSYNNRIAGSIMFPYALGNTWFYAQYRDLYIDALRRGMVISP